MSRLRVPTWWTILCRFNGKKSFPVCISLILSFSCNPLVNLFYFSFSGTILCYTWQQRCEGRSRSGLVACCAPLLRTRRRAGPQRAHRAWPVPAQDRLQVRPHRGEERRRFPETAPAECVDATRSDAAAAQGAGGPAPTCCGASTRNWNSADISKTR